MLTLQEIEQSIAAGSLTNSSGKRVSINEANVKNTQAIKKNVWENPEMKWMRESFQKKQGFDFADAKKFPVMEAGFDWNKVAKKCGYPSLDVAFKEADSSSNFVQVLRAGVQTIVNSMYMTVPTTYESWTTTVNSKKQTELYAPLHGVSFLREVGAQEIYGESRAAGLDIKLINRKYGTLFAVEKELLEDDQTGQFAQQAGLLGEYARLAMECICYAKLAGKFTGGVLANYAGLSIPNTETQPASEANYPFTSSSAPFVGGGSNRPVSFGTLTQPNIQAGYIGLMNQLNLLGIKMQVDPQTIVIGPKYRFDLAVLLNSSFYPSQVSTSAGTTGSAFAVNPIESIAKAVISRFMFDNLGSVNNNSSAWYIMDANKPFFVSQLRNAAEVTQEAPNAGQSFDRDIIRFKVSMRGNADYIDPRFCWQGSDGSV
jgi:phage major head subunit gpT-like protein